jgi:hypothetical protein
MALILRINSRVTSKDGQFELNRVIPPSPFSRYLKIQSGISVPPNPGEKWANIAFSVLLNFIL